MECSSLPKPAFRPDLSSVPLDYLLDYGQAYTGSLELFGAMQPLEYAEKFSRVVLVEPHPVVPH